MENTICFNTKFGWISGTELKNKIISVQFNKVKRKGSISKPLKKLKYEINRFLRGKSINIKIPIKTFGNPKQRRVWKELRKIKKGKTKSYKEISKKLKISPRYVGRICGQNRHVLVIPCHRVIRSNGSLGGFSANGGINLKKRLIKFENQ